MLQIYVLLFDPADRPLRSLGRRLGRLAFNCVTNLGSVGMQPTGTPTTDFGVPVSRQYVDREKGEKDLLQAAP